MTLLGVGVTLLPFHVTVRVTLRRYAELHGTAGGRRGRAGKRKASDD
jgi:hypothetical protein